MLYYYMIIEIYDICESHHHYLTTSIVDVADMRSKTLLTIRILTIVVRSKRSKIYFKLF